jgi:hypothetical protein
MQSSSVVLLQSDLRTAQSLVVPLSGLFDSIYQVRSVEQLRNCVAEDGAQVAVVDLEVAGLCDVGLLSREFPRLMIICNHRLADEGLWTAALNAGAADCCPSYDTVSILRAVTGRASVAQAA